MTRIFCYGTLKKGHGNHDALLGSKFIGEYWTAPKFTMLHLGGFPGVVKAGNTAIAGEVYEVDDDTLSGLDSLESHPDFYERKTINVDGVGSVEIYLLPIGWLDACQNVIEEGVWKRV